MRRVQGKVEPEQRARLVEEGKRLKDRIALLETELDDVEGSLQREGQRLPNVSHPEVASLGFWRLTNLFFQVLRYRGSVTCTYRCLKQRLTVGYARGF